MQLLRFLADLLDLEVGPCAVNGYLIAVEPSFRNLVGMAELGLGTFVVLAATGYTPLCRVYYVYAGLLDLEMAELAVAAAYGYPVAVDQSLHTLASLLLDLEMAELAVAAVYGHLVAVPLDVDIAVFAVPMHFVDDSLCIVLAVGMAGLAVFVVSPVIVWHSDIHKHLEAYDY